MINRDELINRLSRLSDEQYSLVAPLLQADLDTVDELDALHEEIRQGRLSAATEPLIPTQDVYARVRSVLAE